MDILLISYRGRVQKVQIQLDILPSIESEDLTVVFPNLQQVTVDTQIHKDCNTFNNPISKEHNTTLQDFQVISEAYDQQTALCWRYEDTKTRLTLMSNSNLKVILEVKWGGRWTGSY